MHSFATAQSSHSFKSGCRKNLARTGPQPSKHLKFVGRHLDWRVLSRSSACNDSDTQELGPTVGEYETIFRDFQQSVKAARTSADPTQLGGEAISPYAFNLADILVGFDSTSLAVMERVALMNRLDTKFVFSVQELPRVLELLMPYYSILTINGKRGHRYDTLYFDRPTLDLYHQHHNGIYARHKVRYRRYVDTGACFLEVKTKKNTGQTVKRRISRPSVEENIDGEAVEFLQREVPGLADRLQPALRVGFTRLTLVNKNALERLTIDMNVRFDRMKEHCSFQNLVIAELKKDRAVSRSAFVDVMRGRRLKHGSISKYCLGVMSLYPEAKRNRFKERWKELLELAE